MDRIDSQHNQLKHELDLRKLCISCYTFLNMRRGKITPNGVSLEKHENDTVVFFTELGFDIELIPPSKTSGSKKPDFIMDDLEWEMKSPQSNGARTIEHAVRTASKQSENIIIDLRRSKLDTERAITQIRFHTSKRTNIKRLIVITKKGTKLDIK